MLWDRVLIQSAFVGMKAESQIDETKNEHENEDHRNFSPEPRQADESLNLPALVEHILEDAKLRLASWKSLRLRKLT